MTRPRTSIAGSQPKLEGDMEDSKQTVSSRAVATAFGMLGMLAERPGGARLSDLAGELQIPKSTARRILGTLCDLGVVRHDRPTRTYRVGSRLLEYAKFPLGLEPEMIREFHRVVTPIHAKQDETMQLAILSAPDVVFIARVDSSRAVRLVTHIGRRLPAHATAAGKAILAFSDPAEIDQVIGGGLVRYTDNTITDPSRFLTVLDDVRRAGFATEIEESSSNLSCFAAPVFGPDGLVRAGLTICVPTGHVSRDRGKLLIGAARTAAQQLSARL